MVKQGPCCHCGVTSTPLWRNGPAEKPVLCNACGSRWRTKGTLLNYTPLHSRAEPAEFEEYRVHRMRTMSSKNKEAKVHKRKQNHDVDVVGGAPSHGSRKGAWDAPDYKQHYLKGIDEDISNRSSSGSAISNSESYVHLGSADASDLTGPSQSIVWDSMVPSKKRTCVGRPKSSSVEKLTKDLYTILQEQRSYFSGSSEGDLLFESDTPAVSVEIGHGSVLIRHPSSIAREEESEASSLSVYNRPRPANEACSQFTTRTNNKVVNLPFPDIERTKKPRHENEQEPYKRQKDAQEKLEILGTHSSPICYTELKDVLNFDEFRRHLSNDEMRGLLQLLPSIDTVRFPDSLKLMFDSPQLKENIYTLQKLLADGVLDFSSSGVNSECNRTLKRLLLCNMTKSCWVEQYNALKDINCKSSIGNSSVSVGPAAVASAKSLEMKRSCDGQLQNVPGAKTTTIQNPRKVLKTNYELKAPFDNDTCLTTKTVLAPPDSTSLMLDSFQFADESSDHNLLLNIPPHGSFPQAELLRPSSSFGAQASASSSSIYQNHVPF